MRKDVLRFLIAMVFFYVAIKTLPIWSNWFGNLMAQPMKNSLENINKR
jgi:hypothetical protein